MEPFFVIERRLGFMRLGLMLPIDSFLGPPFAESGGFIDREGVINIRRLFADRRFNALPMSCFHFTFELRCGTTKIGCTDNKPEIS